MISQPLSFFYIIPSLQGIKAEIMDKTQQITEIELNNNKLYKELSEAQSGHSQIMDSLQREIEECKDQLNHERETRYVFK